MIPDCDSKTGLLPPDCYSCTIEEFKEVFVDNFHGSKSRLDRFNKYVVYNQKMCQKVKSVRRHLVGGSFTTNKTDPNDVDFVIFVNYTDLTKEEEFFIRQESLKNREDKRTRKRMMPYINEGLITPTDLPCCDRFFVYWRDRKDKNYHDYESDKKKWLNTFGFTREDHRGKRKPRGMVTFLIGSNTFEGD